MNERDRFDKFTERARKVLSLAQEEAQRFQHNYIGTEHLLLGLVREGEGVAAKVLSNLGVELNRVRESVEFIIGHGDRIVLGEMGLTPRAKKVIELAVDEARRLNHHYIGTEHLLLGLVREGEGIAAGVLESMGVNLEKVRTQTIQVLSQSGISQRMEGTHVELTVQLMTTQLNKALDALASVLREKEQAVQQKEYERAAELHDREIKLRDRISNLESALRRLPGFSQTHFTQSAIQIDDDTFDTFTVQLERVLSRSQEEAQFFQLNYSGTEHLLLALIHESSGVAAEVLSNLDVDANEVRKAVENIIGHGDRIVLGEIGFTPRAKKVIELTKDEARRMKHHYVGIEHLLLGLIREGEGIAAGVLLSLGVTLEKAQAETQRALSEGGEGSVQQKSQEDKESIEASGEENAASIRLPIQDADDRIQELSQEENDFIQTLGRFSQDDRDRYEKFTVRARRVLRFAREEAQRFQHNYIGTEHLLLGLVRENGGIAAAVLRNLGVELNKVRSAVEFIIGQGDRMVLGKIGFTPRVKKMIELADDEARSLNHDYIGTEHLLLGMVREGEGIAVGVLESMGVPVERVRIATIKVLNQEKNSI